MRAISPLRYPGGKTAITTLLSGIRKRNRLGGHSVAEPYAGGAGASLSLLCSEEAASIHLNDADQAIHDFWWSLLNEPDRFCGMLRDTPVTMTEWRRQRNVYRNERITSRTRKGFATFFLNRCNRSGIIVNGGPIGGLQQTGEWKLAARFNKKELLERCKRVCEYRSRIQVSCEDGIALLGSLDSASTFFFIDPPYFHKGPTLYLNLLDRTYHEALATKLRSMEDAAWALTYDDCPEIRTLYAGWAKIRPFALNYAAARRRLGREVLIVPKWIQLPPLKSSPAIRWYDSTS